MKVLSSNVGWACSEITIPDADALEILLVINRGFALPETITALKAPSMLESSTIGAPARIWIGTLTPLIFKPERLDG